MREKVLYVVFIPLVIFLIVVYLFHNRWIKSGIEYAAEEVVGAKVEIDDLKLNFSPLGIEWAGIHVANPNDTWKNLFETGRVKFLIDFNQLLRGKYIIDLLEVEDLVIDTKRKTDGAITVERRKRAILAGDKWTFSKLTDDVLKNMINTTPLFDLVQLRKGFNADSLVKALDMKTIKHIDTVKTKINGLGNQWSLLKNDYENQKQKVLEVEKQVLAINPSELNNVQNITNAIVVVDNATKTVNDISLLLNNKSKSFQNDFESITESLSLINTFVKSDFEKLKSMARLPSINTNGMAQLLVGTEMYKRAKAYLSYLDLARNNIQKYQSEPDYEIPPRMEGQDIKFPVERGYPKLWIKKILITAKADIGGEIFFGEGDAKNISDNQKLSGAPLTVSLQGITNSRSLKLSGLFDRRTENPLDEIVAELSGVPVNEFDLGKSDFLPTKISDAVMATKLKISTRGNTIDLSADLKLDNVAMKFETEPKNIAEQLVRDILIGVKNFNVGLRLWNTNGYYDVAVSTDLDQILTQRVSVILGKEIAQLQNELQVKFDTFIQSELGKFNEVYKSKLDDLQNQLGGYSTLILDKTNIIDNKKQELVAQLEKQKSGFIENKLKDLFKKQ